MLQQHVLSGKRWNTKICCKNLTTRSKSFQPSLLLTSNQIPRCKKVSVNSEFWFILSCWQSCTVIPRSNPLRQRHFSSYFADISWTENRSCFSNKAKSWSNFYAFLPCCSFEATVHPLLTLNCIRVLTCIWTGTSRLLALCSGLFCDLAWVIRWRVQLVKNWHVAGFRWRLPTPRRRAESKAGGFSTIRTCSAPLVRAPRAMENQVPQYM